MERTRAAVREGAHTKRLACPSFLCRLYAPSEDAGKELLSRGRPVQPEVCPNVGRVQFVVDTEGGGGVVVTPVDIVQTGRLQGSNFYADGKGVVLDPEDGPIVAAVRLASKS